jgi:hypothetical protein
MNNLSDKVGKDTNFAKNMSVYRFKPFFNTMYDTLYRDMETLLYFEIKEKIVYDLWKKCKRNRGGKV